MVETAEPELWRDLKPIAEGFRPGAAQDVYVAEAGTDDDRYYVPFAETVSSRPLWISPTQTRSCDVLYAKGPGLVNRHYHPHQVFGYTISGKWGYLKHEWVATAGDCIHESPGEGHTLVAYDYHEPMKVHFNVTGPLIWLDEDGQSIGQFDVFDYIKLCRGALRQGRHRRRVHRRSVSIAVLRSRRCRRRLRVQLRRTPAAQPYRPERSHSSTRMTPPRPMTAGTVTAAPSMPYSPSTTIDAGQELSVPVERCDHA